MRAAVLQVNKADLLCDFCEIKGHDKEHCFAKRDARAAACQKAAERHLNRCTNKKGGQQHAQEAAAIPSTTQSVSMAYAGKLALDVSSPDLNGPSLPSPVDPSADWNADTGATCHMTPHLHWFTTYKPHKIPIRFADSKVIWSAGVGSVRFLCCLRDLACLLYVLWQPCGPVAHLCVAWESWLMSWSGTVT
jgi:hypothetical protein